MFEKNMEALRKTQPTLAKKLESVEVGDRVTLFLGPNEDVNIAYENVALHRMKAEGPLADFLHFKGFSRQFPHISIGNQQLFISKWF